MPLLLLFGGGALVGGGTIWAIDETANKLLLLSVVAGIGYYIYKKS